MFLFAVYIIYLSILKCYSTPCIKKEVLKEYISINSQKTKTIFESLNGDIVDGNISKELEEKCKNQLLYKSFLRITIENCLISQKIKLDLFTKAIFESYAKLFLRINIIDDDRIEHLANIKVKNLEIESSFLEKEYMYVSPNTDVIPKKRYEVYKKNITKLTKFIQLFKNDVLDIEIIKKENEEKFEIEKLIVYNDYKINFEFESTGIKKIIKLFSSLQKVSHGHIVFIDEFDANINDVHLMRIIDYVKEYTNGQLIFTTHSLGPMEVLRNNKNALDFLTSKNKVVPWVKNGNYSPSKIYREGYIEGIPFNVTKEDFLSVFGNDDE